MVVTERQHVVNALVPLSRALNTASAVINVEKHHNCSFFIVKGAGAVGTGTITVEACDDITPTNQAAITFKSRRMSPNDTWGAVTDRAAVGFVTTAAANDMYEIIVDPSVVQAATVNGTTGHSYVRVDVNQVNATDVNYGIVAVLSKPRYPQSVQDTVLT